ncbi:MAG: hypothetical protein JWR27_2288 [Aeromicrobium sp.]|jgi:hypothetical protein|nr:hypothetical protein [Aeromicrobium sp.]
MSIPAPPDPGSTPQGQPDIVPSQTPEPDTLPDQPLEPSTTNPDADGVDPTP